MGGAMGKQKQAEPLLCEACSKKLSREVLEEALLWIEDGYEKIDLMSEADQKKCRAVRDAFRKLLGKR